MMVAAVVLRLGRYTRFVSVSVLTGFLTGVVANIILGRLADLLGSPQKGSPALVKAWSGSRIRVRYRRPRQQSGSARLG